MGRNSKSFAFFLISIFALSCLTSLTIRPANAEIPLPTPSVPQFNLKFAFSPYNVTTTDLKTGKNVTKQYENNTIKMTIKNQSFPPSPFNTFYICYDVQTKDQSSQRWIDQDPNWASNTDALLLLTNQSTTQYTVLYFPADYQFGHQIDFQVKAILVYPYTVTYTDIQNGVPVSTTTHEIDTMESNWSQTQTFTMPSTFLIQNATNIIAVLAIIDLLAVFAIVLLIRHRKTANFNQ